MLEVITGRFHPHLESKLIDHIRRTKASDPFAPIALLVPSAPLLTRIRHLLAIEEGLSLLNVHILSFHQLALRLADEVRARSGTGPLRIIDDLFFEQLIRHLIRHRLAGLIPFETLGRASGTWGALWSTIRDLKDGGVDPVAALRGVEEGCFDREDAGWLHALFSLHAAVKNAGAALEVGTADDLAESLLPHVSTSPFLTSLRRIIYYGFYDLTQVQLSLFEAVSATAPTTLLFPLEEGRSFDFARRFFERHIQPKGTTPLPLSDQAKSGSTMPALSIHSVIGLEEELASTCRAILDLCETNGYRFHEIGVVARTLDPYRSILQETFDRHCIPFVTTGGRPLIHEPLCKLLLQLASLPTNDFYRTPVLDIVSSPLYVSSVDHAQSVHYRPEQWKLIVSALHVTHGLDEWKRLEQASHATLSLEGNDDDTSMFGSLDVASQVIELCWQVVSPLLEECAALPQRGRIGQLLDAFRQVVVRHLCRPEVEEVDGEDPLVTRLRSTWTAIDRAWSTLQELDAIGEDLSWAEFAELLTHALERTAVPLSNGAQQGVMVLDAMAARGLPFKALFILGLNEKVFPRYIREDPFLRDRHRRVLDATLGFKIDEKLGGYDEEMLLFTLLCQAATERLSLSFQRADESGRMLAASPYVAEGGRQFKTTDCLVEAVPRRVTDRIAQRPTMRLFLLPSELVQWMVIHGQDPAPLLRAVKRDHELFSHAVEALERIEDDAPALSSFDGQTGPLPSHWSRVQERGIAPTPLERYARCPFQYFAADVLHLEPVRLPIALEPDAALLGTLCHAALRLCYESLLQAGWPTAAPPGSVIRQHIEEAVARASESCEVRHRTGHYLLWELAKEQVQALVSAAVEADRIAQTEDPYLPIAFEVEAEGTVPLTIQGGSEPLKVHGRVDRIDRHRDSGALRIVDYKYKTGSAMKPEDRNLVQSAVRGTRLQPPLYVCLDLPEQGRAQQVRLFFLASHWTTPVAHKTYEATTWSSESGTLIRQTLDRLVAGIREGRFHIVPDSYCKTCDYRIACRREHSPTWWRSHRAAEVKGLRALRTVRVKDE